MSFDTGIFQARAAADPELRYTQGGTPVATFSLALGRKSGPDGADATIYPDFVAYGETATKVMESIHKGSRVVISKSLLDIRKWTSPDGVKHTKYEYKILNASDFYVEWTPEQSDVAGQGPQVQAQATQKAATPANVKPASFAPAPQGRTPYNKAQSGYRAPSKPAAGDDYSEDLPF